MSARELDFWELRWGLNPFELGDLREAIRLTLQEE